MASCGSLRSGLERGEAELRKQRARLDSLAQRTVKFEADIVRMLPEIEQSQLVERAPRLWPRWPEAEARRAASTATTETLSVARQNAAEEVSRSWKARKDALQMALDSARAPAGAQRLANLDGVVGTLLELVEIDPGWEPAVEAAMGEALLAVVVANPESAKNALQSLRSAKTSGAVMALGLEAEPRHTPGVGESVRTHVRAHSAEYRVQIEALLDGLLGGAVRVSSWNDAVEIALTHPAATVVTDEGDRFGASGWRLGVAGGGATAAALEEAITRADTVASELARIDGELTIAKAESNAARQTEAELTRKLDGNDARFTAASEGLARVQADRREIAAEVETAERAVTEASERVERERQRIAELDGLVPALEADEAAENAAARARGEARARIEARAAQLASKRKDLEVRNAGIMSDRCSLNAESTKLSGACKRMRSPERRQPNSARVSSEASQLRVAWQTWLTLIATQSKLAWPSYTISGGDKAKKCAPSRVDSTGFAGPGWPPSGNWTSRASVPGASSWKRPKSEFDLKRLSTCCGANSISNLKSPRPHKCLRCLRGYPLLPGFVTSIGNCVYWGRLTRLP